MIAQLPESGVFTIYSVIGDLFVYLCMAFICSYVLVAANIIGRIPFSLGGVSA